jgi:hypothetical protein
MSVSVSAVGGALISDKWAGSGRLQRESFEGAIRDGWGRRVGLSTDGGVGIEVGSAGLRRVVRRDRLRLVQRPGGRDGRGRSGR